MMPLNEQQIQKLENLLSLKWEIKLLMNLNQLDMILMNAIKTHKDTLVELSKFYMYI